MSCGALIISIMIIIYDFNILIHLEDSLYSHIYIIILTVILNVYLIFIIIYNCKKLQIPNEKLDILIDLFDSSNDIHLINNKLDECCNNNNISSKYNIIQKIIKILTERKRKELYLSMKENLRNNNLIITKEIIKKELNNMDKLINNYNHNLLKKQYSILKIIKETEIDTRINHIIIDFNN
jgi:hypothetical protein